MRFGEALNPGPDLDNLPAGVQYAWDLGNGLSASVLHVQYNGRHSAFKQVHPSLPTKYLAAEVNALHALAHENVEEIFENQVQEVFNHEFLNRQNWLLMPLCSFPSAICSLGCKLN